MFDFAPYRLRIEDLCRASRVITLSFFGSAVRSDFNADSDIDALVTFAGTDLLFDRYFDLKEGLERILGRRVDLVMEDAIRNVIFARAVESERKTFYAA